MLPERKTTLREFWVFQKMLLVIPENMENQFKNFCLIWRNTSNIFEKYFEKNSCNILENFENQTVRQILKIILENVEKYFGKFWEILTKCLKIILKIFGTNFGKFPGLLHKIFENCFT